MPVHGQRPVPRTRSRGCGQVGNGPVTTGPGKHLAKPETDKVNDGNPNNGNTAKYLMFVNFVKRQREKKVRRMGSWRFERQNVKTIYCINEYLPESLLLH
jgi:hypothetical protein